MNMERQGRSWDIWLGLLLSAAALVFGAVGLGSGLRGIASSTTWYWAALVLGLSSGAVLIDELRGHMAEAMERRDAWLGTILLLGALATGVVGFILGITDRAHASTWLTTAAILAVLAMTALVDELRRLRHGGVDLTFTYAAVFGALGLVMGAFGFILGLMDYAASPTWLWAAGISSVVALGAQFAAEHRAALNAEIAAQPPRPTTPGHGTVS